MPPVIPLHGLPTHRPIVRSILNSVVDGLIVVDPSGELLFFNPSAARILGMGTLDAPVSAWPEAFGLFLDDETTPYPAESLPLARANNGQTVHDELLFVRNPEIAEGAWISVNAAPWVDAAGQPLGAIATFRNVTVQKEASEHGERLSSAVEQTADSVLITKKDGEILYVNPAFEQTSGYTLAEVLGQTPRLLRSGKQDSYFYADMWMTLLSGHTFRGTLVNRKKSGELYHAEQTITPMWDEVGRITHFVSVMKDITGRMKVLESEAELQMARRVQQWLYPRQVPEFAGVEIAGTAQSSGLMCGDYFDYFLVPGYGLGLAVADVSGHGLGPSLVMVGTRASLRSCIEAWSNPSETLKSINATLMKDLQGGHFVTMLLACVDVHARTLTYANAGHPPGYLLDNSGNTKLVLGSTAIPLGMQLDMRGLPHRTVAIEPGDLILFLTDGFLESARPDGACIDIEDLLEVVRRHHDAPVQQILDGLYEHLRLFLQGEGPKDDVTAMICRISVP